MAEDLAEDLAPAVGQGDVAAVTQALEDAPSDERELLMAELLVMASLLRQRGIIEALLRAGADINAANFRGHCALSAALAYHDVDQGFVDFLLALRPPPDLNAANGAPLRSAAAASHLGLMQRLIDSGADVNLGDSSGIRPLHMACAECRDTASMRLLLKAGATADLSPSPALDVLHNRQMTEPLVAMRLLLENGLKLTMGANDLLCTAAQHSSAMLDLLLQSGVPVSQPALQTALHRVCAISEVSSAAVPAELRAADLAAVIRRLVCQGASATAPGEGGLAGTPLHSASVAAIAPLLECGADLEARNGHGQTPLHVAAANGRPERIIALILAGADLAARERHGRTPEELYVSFCTRSHGARGAAERWAALLPRKHKCP